MKQNFHSLRKFTYQTNSRKNIQILQRKLTYEDHLYSNIHLLPLITYPSFDEYNNTSAKNHRIILLIMNQS